MAEALAAFLRWWWGELRGMLPHRRPALLVLHIEEGALVATLEGKALGRFLPADPELQASLAKYAKKADSVVLRLPPRRALRKTLDLPLAAGENLAQVLAFEMDRQTPFKADQVYFGYRLLPSPDPQRLRVEMVVVPKREVEGWLERLPFIRRVEVEGMEGIDLIPESHRPRTPKAIRRLNLSLASLALFLALAVLLLPLWQIRQQNERLEPLLAKARREADEVLALRERLEKRIREARFLIDKKQHSPIVMEVLLELTRLLPDDTWLSTFDLKGSKLRIQGESSAASALIALLESSPRFEKVSFASPVTRNPSTGKERFQIAMNVKGGLF